MTVRAEETIRLRLAFLVKKRIEAIKNHNSSMIRYWDGRIFEVRYCLDEVGD